MSVPADDVPFDLETAPLELDGWGGYDWGGDGSDLQRPLRAHVLAALQPTTAPYPPPLATLLTLGDPRTPGVVRQRDQLAITQEHVADLARMARDRALYTALDDTPAIWARVHAVDTLAALDPTPVLEDLLPLLDLADEWFDTALPEIFGRAGTPALELLAAYLSDRTRWVYGRSTAVDGLQEVAQTHPASRAQVVTLLSAVLADAANEHITVISSVVDSLVELGATETLPLIREAFALGKVDESLRGDWVMIQRELGVTPDPSDPLVIASRQRSLGVLTPMLKERGEAAPAGPQTMGRSNAAQKAKTAKNKRKQASQSRKANKRKK